MWHHGLISARGRPDHTSLRELGRIINQKFRLGVHGHTHQDEVDTLHKWLKGRAIPVIATGSFAAGALDRPGGVRNQVSLLELNRAIVRWTVFAREESSEQWARKNSRFLPIADLPDGAIDVLGDSIVERHERCAVVDEQGIVTIKVILHDVDLEGELVLASVVNAPGTVLYDPKAHASRGPGRGSTALDVASRPGVGAVLQSHRRERFARIEWSYKLANVLALYPDEIDFISPDRRTLHLGPQEHDVWLHTLKFCCNELVLRLELPPGRLDKVGAPRAQWRSNGKWVHDTEESPFAAPDGANAITLSVHAPKPGGRYGVTYSLTKGRDEIAADVWDFVGTVLDRCRSELLDQASIATQLADHTDVALKSALSDDVPQRWVVHLWNAPRLALQAAYGRFPARTWGSSFAYGQGIAGHAFKVRGPAVYHRGGRSSATRAIYSRFHDHVDHHWIVSLPLVIAPGRPPVGVIGFAHYGGLGPAWLEQDAKELASLEDPRGSVRFDQIDEKFGDLSDKASLAFWMCLASRAKKDGALAMAETILTREWARFT